jgi:hypothetical protein
MSIKYNEGLSLIATLIEIRVPCPIVPVINTKGVAHVGGGVVVWQWNGGAEFEDNSDVEQVGSYYPVAIDIASSDVLSRTLQCTVTIDAQMIGVPLLIGGGNDAAETVVSSDASRPLIFTTASTQVTLVEVSPPWARNDVPWGVAGNISWRVTALPTGQVRELNSSRLEFYAIAGALPAFYGGTVDVTLLRRLVLPRRSSTSWVEHCCQRTFAAFAFVYDSDKGQPAYARSHTGGGFNLAAYLADIGSLPRPLVNCYDQASIMQIGLGLAPATLGAGYVFLLPFGFIKTTLLVGRGVCNNPFFLDPQWNPAILCDNNAPNRSGFGNHAFVALEPGTSDKIVDTCCGYYNGTLTLAQYIAAAIQTEADTTLYALHHITPGTAASAKVEQGVTNLKGLPTVGAPADKIPTPTLPPFSAEVERMIERATAPPTNAVEVKRHSDAALRRFFAHDVAEHWAVARSAVHSSPDGTFAEWRLEARPRPSATDTDKDNNSSGSHEVLLVDIFVASSCDAGAAAATAAFANHLGAYHRPLDSLFRAPPAERVRGQLNLETYDADADADASARPAGEPASAASLPSPSTAPSPSPASSLASTSGVILLWVYGNVFVRISHRADAPHRNTARVHALADQLHERIAGGAKPAGASVLAPRISRIRGPDGAVAVRSIFVVNVSLEGKAHADVESKAGVSSLWLAFFFGRACSDSGDAMFERAS